MIVVGIATIPSRINQLINTVNSLYEQVDKINISFNNYTHFPEIPELYRDKIFHTLTKGTDEQKFRQVEGEIYLSVDDDLLLPYNYVATIINALEEYDIITFHGRSFDTLPIQSYYKSKSRRYRCLDKVSDDINVQVGGTGCMAFRTDRFFLSLNDFQYRYMADIQVAIVAKRQGKKIKCIAHESGWIKYQPVSNTIFDRFRDDDKLQTSLINSHFG